MGFTEQWQNEARREEARQQLAQMYERRFGADDYAELKRVRQWLDEHPHKQEILAYLNDAAPLDA